MLENSKNLSFYQSVRLGPFRSNFEPKKKKIFYVISVLLTFYLRISTMNIKNRRFSLFSFVS